jgi:methionyl-tRNA synthetase
MLYPIIPKSIEKALTIFDLKVEDIKFESIGIHEYLKGGNNVNKINILFKKIVIND